jgi:hypothetical protein
MNREVGRFLLESWQLFYWSFFCPSRLQQRMNDWSSLKKRTPGIDLDFPRFNFRFNIQYIFALTILNIPLIILIYSTGRGLDWLLLIATILSSLFFGYLFLPSGTGFCIPLLSGLTYWSQSENLALFSLLFSTFISSIEMFTTMFFIYICIAVIPVVSTLLMATFLLMIGTIFCWDITIDLKRLMDKSIRYLMTVLLVVGIFGGFLVVIGEIISIIYGITNISLPLFLLACVLGSLGSPLKFGWAGILVSIFFIVLGWENLSFKAILAIPTSVIIYYRILPDYLLTLARIAFIPQKYLLLNPSNILLKLPPYTTELLWLPLPGHAQILTNTFRQEANLGLATFQKMQSISLPGFQLTIQKALPSIVADLFTSVNTTAELIGSFAFTHPLFPLLIPTFYQFDENTQSPVNSKLGNLEISILFPRLQQIAKDTSAALKGGSSTLRERGLEKLVTQLIRLPSQLPGLGLQPQAVKRWQPAIERWQHILELEIAEQQKTSQGELLNPFQWGNPLRPDRAAIFKGRQDFADRLVRLILDRNRPTLVLHGPRRAGKTSFLLNLPRLLPSDLVPIYLDMQQGSMTASEGDFCYGLVRAIQRDASSQGLRMPYVPSRQEFTSRPYTNLRDWLDDALSKPILGDRRLLLNLDEFEKIGSAIKDNRISDRLFDELRSMIQHYDRLGFLFSGVQTLEELGPRWSNYFISVVPMEMHYLEPHEAEDLLLNPDPEFTLQYDTGIVAEILRLTRCQPYLLQLIGSAIVNQANLQHTQIATTALLQAAIQDAFTNGEPYFTNIWTEFTGNNDNPAEVTAGQQILIALAQGNPHVETNDETTTARRRLLRYHVIERNGDIDMIEIPLFEQWVRERAIET